MLGLGLGATDEHALGRPGRPVLELPVAAVLRWRDTARCRDLWSAAVLAATRASGNPGAVPDNEAALAQLPAALADLPVLVSHLCGHLDLA